MANVSTPHKTDSSSAAFHDQDVKVTVICNDELESMTEPTAAQPNPKAWLVILGFSQFLLSTAIIIPSVRPFTLHKPLSNTLRKRLEKYEQKTAPFHSGWTKPAMFCIAIMCYGLVVVFRAQRRMRNNRDWILENIKLCVRYHVNFFFIIDADQI